MGKELISNNPYYIIDVLLGGMSLSPKFIG
jgi:hypothetical protein